MTAVCEHAGAATRRKVGGANLFALTARQALCIKRIREIASVAQLVEQLIRNQQVRGSSPLAGSRKDKGSQASCFGTLFR